MKARCKKEIIETNMHLNIGDEFYVSNMVFDERSLYILYHNKEKTRFFMNIFGDEKFNSLFEVIA